MTKLPSPSVALFGLLTIGSIASLPACADQREDSIAARPKPLFGMSHAIWTGSVVPVCYDNPGPENATERAWVRAAVERSWGSVSGASFVWQDEPCNNNIDEYGGGISRGVHIRIADEHPRVLAIGANLSGFMGGMILNFTFRETPGFMSCAGSSRQYCIEAIAVHEFGHALGFVHEQNRPDTPSTCLDAPQGSYGDTLLTPWDAESTMNYCNRRWNNGGELSAYDQSGSRAWYGSPRQADIDPVFYLRSYPDLVAAFGPSNWDAAINHYYSYGINEGRRASPYFDAAYYLSRYPDVAQAFGANNFAAARQHWLENGIREGRSASVAFDVAYYAAANPDVAAVYGNDYVSAFQHFRDAGVYEGRPLAPGFHPRRYLELYPDVVAAYGAQNYAAAFEHFARWGVSEGRRGTY